MIKFTVRANWSDRHVACRVAQIIGSADVDWDGENKLATPPFQQDETKWQLDGGNDWWLHKLGDHEYGLSYRYDYAADMAKILEGLQPFLQWVFQ